MPLTPHDDGEMFSLDFDIGLDAGDGRGVRPLDMDLPVQIGSREPGRGIDFHNPGERRQGRARGPPSGVRRDDHPGRGPPEDPPGGRRGFSYLPPRGRGKGKGRR